MNNQLMVMNVEKDQAEMKLKQQINTVRNIIDNLERRLENNETIFDSEGLQGNGVYLDALVSKVATYQRATNLFKTYLERENKNDSGVDIAEIIEEMRMSIPNRRLLEVTKNLAVEIHPKEANEVKRVIFLKKRDEGAVTKFVAYNPERDVETYHDETVLIAVKELKQRGQEAVAKL